METLWADGQRKDMESSWPPALFSVRQNLSQNLSVLITKQKNNQAGLSHCMSLFILSSAPAFLISNFPLEGRYLDVHTRSNGLIPWVLEEGSGCKEGVGMKAATTLAQLWSKWV